jgi:hypothetical protein
LFTLVFDIFIDKLLKISFRESIAMGYTKMDKEEIKNVIDELSREWRGNSYNLLTRCVF